MVEDENKPKKNYLVPAVDQAMSVIHYLAAGGGLPRSLTDICREVGIHRSKAFSILDTLAQHGVVKKNANRKGYTLGPGLLTIAGQLLETMSLPRVAEPVLYDLAKKVRATVTLGVVSDDKTYIVAEYHGAPGIGVSSPIGSSAPVTYGAHGKAIAAFLPPSELKQLLTSKELYFHGAPHNYQPAKLQQELAETRRTGFAVEIGDIQKGMNAVAAPLLNQDDYPVGYVTVVGFFSEEEVAKLGPLVVEAVAAIMKEMGHSYFWEYSAYNKMLS